MYTYIDKAVNEQHIVFILTKYGDKIAGIPSWGIVRNRVKITAPGLTVYVPLDEIRHVSTKPIDYR